MLEGVGRVGIPIRLHDGVVFIDHHDRRHVGDRVQLSQDMIDIHQNRIGNAIHETSDGFGVFIDRNRNYLEVVIGQFVLQYLPTWQVKDASSPA